MKKRAIKVLLGTWLMMGGLVMLIGTIGFFVNNYSSRHTTANTEYAMGCAIVARIGAILTLLFALILIIAVCLKKLKRQGIVAAGFFALMGFVGQFMINSVTNMRSAISSLFKRGSAETAFIGFILLFVAGLGTIFTSLIITSKKNLDD